MPRLAVVSLPLIAFSLLTSCDPPRLSAEDAACRDHAKEVNARWLDHPVQSQRELDEEIEDFFAENNCGAIDGARFRKVIRDMNRIK